MESPMPHTRNVPHANHTNNPTITQPYDDLIQLVMAHGPDAIAQAFTQIMNQAMLIERQQHLGARLTSAATNASLMPTTETASKPCSVSRLVFEVGKNFVTANLPSEMSDQTNSTASPHIGADTQSLLCCFKPGTPTDGSPGGCLKRRPEVLKPEASLL